MFLGSSVRSPLTQVKKRLNERHKILTLNIYTYFIMDAATRTRKGLSDIDFKAYAHPSELPFFHPGLKLSGDQSYSGLSLYSPSLRYDSFSFARPLYLFSFTFS